MLILSLFLIAGCGGNKARQEREAALAEQVQKALEDQGKTIVVGNEEPEENVPDPEPTLPADTPEPENPFGDLDVNTNLKDIATFGKDMKFIVGSENPSKDITTILNIKSLFMKYNLETGDAIMDKEANDLTTKNYFVIGSPCGNSVAATLLKKYIDKKGDCHIFRSGEAWVRVIPTSKTNFAIYIGGDDSAETERAAMLLGNFNYYAVHGDFVRVGGTVENPSIE